MKFSTKLWTESIISLDSTSFCWSFQNALQINLSNFHLIFYSPHHCQAIASLPFIVNVVKRVGKSAKNWGKKEKRNSEERKEGN